MFIKTKQSNLDDRVEHICHTLCIQQYEMLSFLRGRLVQLKHSGENCWQKTPNCTDVSTWIRIEHALTSKFWKSWMQSPWNQVGVKSQSLLILFTQLRSSKWEKNRKSKLFRRDRDMCVSNLRENLITSRPRSQRQGASDHLGRWLSNPYFLENTIKIKYLNSLKVSPVWEESFSYLTTLYTFASPSLPS